MQEEWFQVSPSRISWAAKAKPCMRHSRYVHEEFGQLLRHNNAHHAISDSGHVGRSTTFMSTAAVSSYSCRSRCGAQCT